MQEHKERRGGARAGAGRPRLDTKPIALRLSADALAILERMSADSGKSKSKVVEYILLDSEH